MLEERNINSNRKTCAMRRVDRRLRGGKVTQQSLLVEQKHQNLNRTIQGEEPKHQFLQNNDPLKLRRVSSLSEKPRLSLYTVQGKKRGMNTCVLGTQHWQWSHTTPTKASIKKERMFWISLGHFISSCVCTHVGLFDWFYCHCMFRMCSTFIFATAKKGSEGKPWVFTSQLNVCCADWRVQAGRQRERKPLNPNRW